jgi:hypothetical protein
MWKARKLALISLAVCVLEVTILLCIRMFATHPISHSAHSVAIKKHIAATVLLVCDHVGSVSAAKRAQQAGADFIIAQGVEAGGHVAGTVSTMVLVPRVVDSVAPTPVVAAGGIADGRGLAAALALGQTPLYSELGYSRQPNAMPTRSTKGRFLRRAKKNLFTLLCSVTALPPTPAGER